MPHHIFLSYSRKDSEIMRRVKGDFEAAGLTVWTDEGIEPGTPNWQRAIQKAILDAGCLVGILSPDAAQSDWVLEELNFARMQLKPLFLFLWRGDERNAVPFGFSTFQWVDIRTSDFYVAGIARSIGTIREQLKLEPQIPLQLKSVLAIIPPPFEWCSISPGVVPLPGRGLHIGFPSRSVRHFWMAKYPITNAQFEAFADAKDGYIEPFWWNVSEDAQNWRAEINYPKIPRIRVIICHVQT